MTTPTENPDVSVRGGVVNVPPSTTPRWPPRHQPNTPINKKFAPQKPKAKKRQSKTKPTPADDSDQPPGESQNVSAPPS